MRLEAQDFLRLVENNKTLAIWDTESQGLNGDYGAMLCASIKTFGRKEPVTFRVEQLGNDKRLVRETRDYLEGFDAWVTYFGKGHDVPLLNTRLLKWGLKPVDPRPHVDLFFTLKPKLRTSSKSQAHLLRFLGTPEQKMSVSPDTWASLGTHFYKNMLEIVARCESDAAGLEALYNRTKHVIRDITR